MSRRDRWVAPAEDGGILFDPPPDRVEELLETNRRRFAAAKLTVLDQSLTELRHAAREVAPYSAFNSAKYGSPIIATGHQPDLYHPGVWLKNFATFGVARRLGVYPLNVVLDSDTRKTSAMNLPTWGERPADIGVRSVVYDDPVNGQVHGLGQIRDQWRFSTFADRSSESWAKWPFRPLLPDFWSRMLQVQANDLSSTSGLDCAPNVSDCYTHARRETEVSWGCANDEISFLLLRAMGVMSTFVAHFLLDLPRVHAVYNECVKAYRRKYRLKSHTHPVPNLGTDEEGLEAPFWWIDVANANRHRVFVRSSKDRLEIRSRCGSVVVSRTPTAIRKVLNAPGTTFLCPRALMTTLFLRLCVADLFIHGIGGAKYDEVTDDIIRRYFGIEPPEYVVVSGTLRLPFPHFPATTADRQRLQRRLRDLRWHPEQFIDAPNALVEQKRRWLEREPMTHDERRARYRELLHLTEALRPMVADQTAVTEERLSRCDAELAANAILRRRDYPFLLYPESLLRPFLTQLL